MAGHDRQIKNGGAPTKRWNKNTVKNPAFKDAVDACTDIKDDLKVGLSALKSNSRVVRPTNTKLIDGSVDIDNAVKHLYPNEARWDYVVGYSNEAFFIEVHPAGTSNVKEMIAKVSWLKKWLASSAPLLKSLQKSEVYYWVPSGGVSILKGSVQYKQLAANKLRLQTQVNIP